MKAIQHYENTVTPKQKAYLQMQCRCVLCNALLVLSFENLNSSEIKETAKCPQCDIKTRTKTHIIN